MPDMCILIENVDDHILTMARIFVRMHENGLIIKPSKIKICYFNPILGGTPSNMILFPKITSLSSKF